MKIATYNIWNHNIEKREAQLIDILNKIDADIVGLQEVPSEFYGKLVAGTNYKYHAYAASDKYKGAGDFVAVLSKHPLLEHFTFVDQGNHDGINAHNVIFEVEGMRFSFTNVHLPWDSVLAKERQIVAIQDFICSQEDKADFFILAGDFNCGVNSSVHRFLLGDSSLFGSEANPYWNDLSGVHAALNGYKLAPTLDFSTNPRWKGENTTHEPAAVDRIYVMECMRGKAWDYDWSLGNVTVFGRDISPKTGLAPSDHYGVMAEVEFSV
ncbi:MAG: endonuclease/exonuclease/phosphatase family protein [Defluviitaleaceae bacterium]|nr:endonuclease/exonuclease/phosphatase family protein [Defluviitaleaceae bacterium]